jgi:hypothetical protein
MGTVRNEQSKERDFHSTSHFLSTAFDSDGMPSADSLTLGQALAVVRIPDTFQPPLPLPLSHSRLVVVAKLYSRPTPFLKASLWVHPDETTTVIVPVEELLKVVLVYTREDRSRMYFCEDIFGSGGMVGLKWMEN